MCPHIIRHPVGLEIELRFDGITGLLTPGWGVDAAMTLRKMDLE
jgi:hypothetical protein